MTTARTQNAGILFTAFEPSGDAHAAPVIAELRHRAPELSVYAWGGPKMQAAGATIIQQTCENAAMGMSALRKVREVRREVKHIARWSKQYRVVAHVPVDSPAANFPICKVMKKRGVKVVHLVAPQLWAWGRWRVRKLRRLTDLVLCLLPFEEPWFNSRGINAQFIGHPRVNRSLDEARLREGMHGLPGGSPRIAILPGSRAHEVNANIRLLAGVFTELQGRHHSLAGVIVAASPELAALVRKRLKMFPTGLHLVSTELDPVIAWSDLCLTVSGTVTLDVARHRKPMVGVYRTGIATWLVSTVLLRTPLRLLPNIIAGREIVPEFVPYCGGVMPILKEASPILLDSKKAAVQSEHLARMLTQFLQKKPAIEAAKHILATIGESERVRPQVASEGAAQHRV